MRQGINWEWTKESEDAFLQLKHAISTASTLAHFSGRSPTFVSCDASSFAIGAVLSQKVGGVERAVAIASRALSDTERKYSVGEKEVLACLWACERWDIYLYGGGSLVAQTTRLLLVCYLQVVPVIAHCGYIVGRIGCIVIILT